MKLNLPDDVRIEMLDRLSDLALAKQMVQNHLCDLEVAEAAQAACRKRMEEGECDEALREEVMRAGFKVATLTHLVCHARDRMRKMKQDIDTEYVLLKAYYGNTPADAFPQEHR